MKAFFPEEFCILLLPAHPGAPSRGVLIGGAGAAPADGLASHLREPRGCCPALQRGPAIGGSSPPDECRRKPAGSGGRKVGPVVVGAVPAAKIAAVERREASVSRGRLRRLRKLVYGARRAPRLASVELLMRLSALRSLGHFSGDDSPGPIFRGRLPRAPWGYEDRRTRRLTKTRADDAWLFDRLNRMIWARAARSLSLSPPGRGRRSGDCPGAPQDQDGNEVAIAATGR